MQYVRSIKYVKSTIWGMIYICTVQAYDWQERRSMSIERGVHHRIAQLCGLWLIDQRGHYDRIVFVT